MAVTAIQFRRRAVGGAAGAPASLKSGEPAYNMQDRTIYVGYGDNGSGQATSVRAIGRDDFWQNIPSNGDDGNILFRTASGVQWGPAPEGALYTASGDGIELNGSQFELNYTEIATGISLGNYLTTATAATTYQPLDGDLTSIAGITGTTGLLRKTAANTWSLDTTDWVSETELTSALGSYITTSAANTAYQPKDADLTAIAGLAGTSGVLRKTAADTWELDTTDMATQTELNNGLSGKANTTHTHAAEDITSGVFDIARIPVLPSSVQEVSSGGIANLTVGQQNNIGDGSVVTTTDGRRWVYTGTGSKTAEASYIELADVTPEWTVIANKPSFATVATSGSYTDLSNRPSLATVATSGSYNDLINKPTLGTMASQNANAVAITGGTIDGVTLDGGTF